MGARQRDTNFLYSGSSKVANYTTTASFVELSVPAGFDNPRALLIKARSGTIQMSDSGGTAYVTLTSAGLSIALEAMELLAGDGLGLYFKQGSSAEVLEQLWLK